ncbi:MAG: hypothetical protein CL916_05755 [Deltaproteobacteria bacterium]|nr:hypothetical protein [Deltaproteobacteria bacterium]
MQIPKNVLKEWPFSVLSKKSKKKLCQQSCVQKTYTQNEEIHTQTPLFFVQKGHIRVYEKEEELSFLHQIGSGCIFGLRETILHTSQKYTLIAQTDVEILSFDPSIIHQLAIEEPQFSLALSRSLRKKSDLFGDIKNFVSHIQTAKREGSVNIERLLPYYRKMKPALHPSIDGSTIDFGAWSYAKNRLPQDILQTHVYLLSTEMPTLLKPISPSLNSVETRYRRRTIKRLGAGKTLILVRDMHTDLIDFLSNLCLHAIEARKMRKKLHKHNILAQLTLPESELEQLLQDTLKADWTNYKALWSNNTIQSLKNLTVHHEDYFLCIEQNENTHVEDATERWITTIQKTCTDLKIDMEHVEIDIISSNRFAMEQCLSPYIHSHKEAITTWGKENCTHILSHLFSNHDDYIYAILPHYLEAFPNMHTLFEQPFEGLYNCNDTSSTGIPVDIIHPASLNVDHVDSHLQPTQNPNHIIINIDYAFGKQAEDILCSLITLFHHNIRSINIMGKAGALVGKRGDILLATHVVLADREVAYPMLHSGIDSNNPFLRNVHKGSVLTVEGTLLQNRPLLHYFQSLWGCVGLEMEGYFYARQIQQAIYRKSVKKTIETNFLYFISDLPMQEGSQLSKDMAPHESIPPLFGIIRSFLHNIFSRDST